MERLFTARSVAAFACIVWTFSAQAAPAAGGAPGFYGTTFEKTPAPAAMTALGRRMFFDASLSASGRQSCASCHDPRFAYGPPNAKAIQSGGPTGRLPGVRAVPSLRYLQNVPAFTEHFAETDGNDSEDQGPAGGNGWDGRAPSKHDQARIPLLSPFEMANANEDAVVARIAKATYADDFRATFGAHVFDDHALAFKAGTLALEVYQQSPSDFYPYDSRYDGWLRGRETLSPREQKGLALFNDANKGNCASCHPSTIREGAFPAFTDFGFAALGVPRNAAIPANADPRYHDLGLCGPFRTDLTDRADYCGLFRAPSLRNVAIRRSFFHNGVAHSLTDAVRFYADRDTNPERWYPLRGGRVAAYDDLPAQYRAHVERDAPFGGRRGGKPSLDDREIADIVAFLQTLTDRDVAPKTVLIPADRALSLRHALR
ncbi:MAG: cytochrome c peroxidase [Burkholderiaceae bacterium]